MKYLSLRYIGLIGGMLGLFSSFVACGTKFYQVSMQGDHAEENVPQESKDPASPQYGIHALQGWQQLPIRFRFGQYVNDDQMRHLQLAMRSWEAAVGKKLFSYDGVHAGVDGDTFKDLYSSLNDSVNGNYLDSNWEKVGKPPVVLATTIWNNSGGDASIIEKADIRFNTQYYVIGDSLTTPATAEKDVVDMQSLALHELGHLLGLTHVDAEHDSYSIMNPTLFIGEGLTQRRLSRGDIERIQQIYSCAGDACDVEATFEKLELQKQEEVSGGSGNAVAH